MIMINIMIQTPFFLVFIKFNIAKKFSISKIYSLQVKD